MNEPSAYALIPFKKMSMCIKIYDYKKDWKNTQKGISSSYL